QEIEYRRHVANFINKPFCLTRDHLVRFALMQRAEKDHTLIIVMHHIVTDGWSMAVFMQELSSLYEAYNQGLENTLPPLTIHYADYCAWQRELLQSDIL